jgi:ATP-dependent DNA ligase
MHKTITLEAPSASGKKFYRIDLVERQTGFTVDYTHGAVGGSVKTGTKTKEPVELARAEKIFDALVREKVNGDSHYVAVDDDTTSEFETPALAATNAEEIKCLPPRLLNDVDESIVTLLVADPAWWVQVKHDGDRVQLHKRGERVTMFSGRSGKVRACPKAIANAKYPPNDMVLDGELVGDVFWVFDVLLASSVLVGVVDVRDLEYELRYAGAAVIVSTIACPTIRIVETAVTARAKAELILKAKSDHEEGVCFLHRDARYEAGRPAKGGKNLRWKFKASASVIVSKLNHKRSVDIELADGTRIGSVSIPPNKPVPPVGAIIEVEYLYCQGSLVQAVYKGVRTDVEREACNRAQIQFKRGVDPEWAS